MKQRKVLNFQEEGLTNHYIFQELLKEPYIFQSIVEEILQYSLGEIERIERDPKIVGNLYSHEIVCDLLAYIKGGILCNIELQNRDMKNFVKRTRYYVSQLQVNHYLRSKEEKDSYDGVPQVISIWLCTFPNFRYGDKKNTLVSYNKELTI